MKINEDIKNIAEFLLNMPPIDGVVTTVIYSSNFTSRHPNLPCYQNPNSIPKMIEDGVLELIESGENGQPAPDSSVIHYFTSYKVTFKPQDIKKYLEEIETVMAVNTKQTKEIYEWNGLVLNFENATLTYKNNIPVDGISKTREMKLLLLLMQKHGDVVNYLKVAEQAGIDTNIENINPKDVAQDIQTIRQDLIDNYLVPAGMKKNDAKALIVNVRNTGYKLG